MQPEERAILEAKYKSKRFGEMVQDELHVCSHGLLLKIHVITGWVIPTSNEFLDILIDQFEKKLSESYKHVNVEEVEYAVRNYGTLIKDWGKQMNLSLIDEIMVPYLTKRREVSDMEESKRPAQIEQKEDLSDQAMSDWLEDTKKRKVSVEFMPVMLYDWIDRKKMIVLSNDEKYEYLQKATSYRLSKLQQDHESNPTAASKKAFDEFLRMKTSGAIEGKEIDIIKNLAKKMIVYDYCYGSKD